MEQNVEGSLFIFIIGYPSLIRVFSYFYYLGSNCVLSVWYALIVIFIMGHYTLKTRILVSLLF
jgi:hypothetical protein